MNEVICKALCKYENLIVMDDFNMDIKSSNCDKDKLEKLCDVFNLTNLVSSEICFMKQWVYNWFDFNKETFTFPKIAGCWDRVKRVP